MTSRLQLTVAAAIGALAITGGAASAHAADAFDAGDVAIVDPGDRRTPLTSGDSTTAFTFELPDDARCGGDSMHDGWRVHSFLVPESTDLSAMVYDANHPIGEGNLPMRDVNGRLYVHEMTDVNAAAGEEAPLNQVPALTLAYWEPEDFPPGTYSVGVACAPASRVVERYWDARIVVIEDTSVQPGERRWEVAEGFVPSDGFPFVRVGLVALAAVASLVFVAVSIAGRSRRDPTIPLDDVEPSDFEGVRS